MRAQVVGLLLLALAACGGDPSPRTAAPAPASTSAVAPSSAAVTTTPPTTAPPTTAAPTTAPPIAAPPITAPPVTAPPTAAPPSGPPAALGGVRVLTPAEVPGAVAGTGTDLTGTVAGLAFTDRAGSDVVVLREVDRTGGRDLSAVHLVRSGSAAPWQVLREVRDGVQDCEFDVTAAFLPGVLAVRDEDGDGTGEVTFGYRTACRSDVSAADQELLLLEGGQKHVLRGRARSSYEADQEPVPEPASQSWPAGTYAATLERWRALPPES